MKDKKRFTRPIKVESLVVLWGEGEGRDYKALNEQKKTNNEIPA